LKRLDRSAGPPGVWGRRLRSWASWSLEDKVELLQLIVLAAGAEVAVRTVALPKLTRRLGIGLGGPDATHSPTPRTRSLSRDTIDRRAAAVDRLYRVWPRRDSCLRRALVLGFRIRAARPTMQIGVAKEEGRVRAHAWIEVDGRVVGDDSGDYAPLRRQGAPPARATAQALRPHGR
jgi:hypothetical protein